MSRNRKMKIAVLMGGLSEEREVSLVSGPGFADQAPMGLAGAAVGLAVGFLPLLAAWMAGGIGGGDAKLMGAVGALAGWRFALAAMFYGFLIAGVMAVAVMLKRRITRKTLARIFRFLYLVFTPARQSTANCSCCSAYDVAAIAYSSISAAAMVGMLGCRRGRRTPPPRTVRRLPLAWPCASARRLCLLTWSCPGR